MTNGPTDRFRCCRVLAIAVLIGAGVAVGSSAAQEPDRQVALTFDDLPMTGSTCDTAEVQAVTRALTDVLASRALPAAGLATPGRACLTAAALKEALGRWVDAGALVGNHTATHPDLNGTPTAEYLADIERAQRLIDAAIRADGRWFRPPYLHSGSDSAAKHALAHYLSANGYRLAPVTVDNQEWVYAAVYAAARARGDTGLAERISGGYLDHLAEAIAFYEGLSRDVFGREIPQVLLLHANRLNADLLARVVEMLAARGYRFVTLAEALSDPAYAREDTYVGRRGLSWLQRWALEDGVPIGPEPREADWVAEAYRTLR